MTATAEIITYNKIERKSHDCVSAYSYDADFILYNPILCMIPYQIELRARFDESGVKYVGATYSAKESDFRNDFFFS